MKENEISKLKETYPPGTRIALMYMGYDPFPIDSNTRGTVDHVDDMGTVHCNFDNGRRLGMVPGEDLFRKLTKSELEFEQAKAEKKEPEESEEDETKEQDESPRLIM